MTGFDWDKQLQTNIREIDIEHIQVLEKLNRVIEYNRKGLFEYEMALMEEIISLARSHFHKEEKILAKMHYPSLCDHKKQHDDVIRRLTDYKKGLKDNLPDQASMAFIKALWLHHMEEEIRELGFFYDDSKNRGYLAEFG